MVIVVGAVLLCAALGLGGAMLYGKYQMGKIPGLTFAQTLEYTTEDNPDAVITVGIIKGGACSYQVYGENGTRLPDALHTYEIGSLTKTVTAALIYKADVEEKLDIESTIDHYLPLPHGNESPTIEELLTHTSGYKAYYLESPMIANFFKGRNDFCGITREMVLARAGSLNMGGDSCGFTYSNFGYALLGLVLEEVYDCDATVLINDFLQNDLGLSATKVYAQSGDLKHAWDWNEHDAYLPAGGITSNIADMLSYAQMQLEGSPYFSACHKSIKAINATTPDYAAMDIRMDEIGMAWITDRENGIIWHNGGTGNYNAYLGFHPASGTAVVILSNLPPSARIPATVLGVKLLAELEQ